MQFGINWSYAGRCNIYPKTAGTTTISYYAGTELKSTITVTVTGAHTPITSALVPATCTEDGMEAGTYCKEGGETLSGRKKIPATGHTPVADPAVEATCTENGLTAGSHCSVCGEVLEAQKAIPAAHTPVVDPAVEATYQEAGLTEGSHCAVCGEILVAQTAVDKLAPKKQPLSFKIKKKVTVSKAKLSKKNQSKSSELCG